MSNTPTKTPDIRGHLIAHGKESLLKAAANTVPYDSGIVIMPVEMLAKGGAAPFSWQKPAVPPPATSISPPPPPPTAEPAIVEVPGAAPSTIAQHPADDESRPPFPMHCIPGAAGVMALEIARVTTSQNESLAAASVLGVLSASLGAGVTLNNGGERWTRPNLFLLPVAESGTGKGEAFSLAAAPLEAVESEMIEDFEQNERPGLVAKMSVAETRSKKLCRDAAREDEAVAREAKVREYRAAELERNELQKRIDSIPRLKVADTTKEALAINMYHQPGEALASLSSEARGILSIIKGRYGKSGGDEEFYCSAYSGDSITVDRVGRSSLVLRRPCLAALWMVQPDAVRDALSESTLTESGFMARFLMFNAEAEAKERHGPVAAIPIQIKMAWYDLVRALLDNFRSNGATPKTVKVSPGAAAMFSDYENENIRQRQNQGNYRDLKPYVARWTENAWKLSLVIHCAKHGVRAHEADLDESTAADAIKIMRWFAMRQIELLASGRHDKLRVRLSALLAVLAEKGGEITLRHLRRQHSFDEPEVRQLQAEFPQHFCIVTRHPASGRPSQVVSNLPADLNV